MAMGRRKKRMRQEGLWTPTAALPVSASHPFYQRLNQILDEKKFDEYVEGICERFYADEVGRPGMAPGIYFRLLMVGYFEGIDSERGIAWRASDSLSIRSFVRIALDESWQPSGASRSTREWRIMADRKKPPTPAATSVVFLNDDLVADVTEVVCSRLRRNLLNSIPDHSLHLWQLRDYGNLPRSQHRRNRIRERGRLRRSSDLRQPLKHRRLT